MALDWGIAATLIAMGMAPMGTPAPSWYARLVAEPPLPPDIIDLGLLNAPNFELLQSLAPTLILVPPTMLALEPLLGRIAPVEAMAIAPASRSGLPAMESETLKLGARVGRGGEATSLVDRARAGFDLDKDALSSRRGEPLVITSLFDDRHVTVFGPGSLYHHVFDRLGLTNAGLTLVPSGESAILSLQTLTGVPAARLIDIGGTGQTAPAVFRESPLLQALPAVREGRITSVPQVYRMGGLPAAMRFSAAIREALGTPAARNG